LQVLAENSQREEPISGPHRVTGEAVDLHDGSHRRRRRASIGATRPIHHRAGNLNRPPIRLRLRSLRHESKILASLRSHLEHLGFLNRRGSLGGFLIFDFRFSIEQRQPLFARDERAGTQFARDGETDDDSEDSWSFHARTLGFSILDFGLNCKTPFQRAVGSHGLKRTRRSTRSRSQDS
jgi:hypothetical protein